MSRKATFVFVSGTVEQDRPFDTFQEHCNSTTVGPNQQLRAILSLGGETGEVYEVIKKYNRGDFDAATMKAKLKEELGDVLYAVARIAAETGLSLEDIAAENCFKREDRYGQR